MKPLLFKFVTPEVTNQIEHWVKVIVPPGFMVWLGETLEFMDIEPWVKLICYVCVSAAAVYYHISAARAKNRENPKK